MSIAIFTLYMYSIRKVIMCNCHLKIHSLVIWGHSKDVIQYHPLKGPFPRGVRRLKRLETSKHPLNGGSGIFLFELIGINRGMMEKVGQTLSPKVKQVQTIEVQMNHIFLKT